MKRALLIMLALSSVIGVYSQQVTISVSGPSNTCIGGSGQYTVSGSSATTGYTWSVTSGGTITSGQGSKTISVSFNSTGTCYIYVTLNSMTVNETVTVSAPPSAPASISGQSIMCPGSTATFTSSVSGATNVTWYTTNGSFVTSQSATSATVTIPANTSVTSFQLNFYGVNSMCGLGPTTSKTVTITNQVPSAPAITGSAQVCLGAQGVGYTAAITNANSYVWSVPPGATIVSGQGTSNIAVNYSSTSVNGNVSVYGTNCNGNGSSASLAITGPSVPGVATSITGVPSVCPGDQSVAYSVVSPIAGASSYVWSVPPGATIAPAGQNTGSITVNYSSAAVSGNVSVYGTNCSGNGSSTSYAVTIKPGPGLAGTIAGKIQVCPGETGVPYSIPTVANATGYVWTVPPGATVSSGQNTNSIVVDFSGATAGTITVAGTYCGGIAGPPSSLQLPLSATASASNVDYSVDIATGTVTASLPLFTVQSGDIQVPGVLSYASTGIQVTEDDGWLGHHWGLSVQSYGVFRDMRNLPDDYPGSSATNDTRLGWLFGTTRTSIDGFIPQPDSNPVDCANEGSNYTFLNGLTYNQDTEPDAFQASAPGLSVTFYFDKNGVPQVMPLQDVVITPYTANGQPFNGTASAGAITSFTVVNSQGVTYTFSEVETMTENMLNIDHYYFVRQTSQHFMPMTYTTAWRLKTIISPVYGTINLSYTPVTSDNNYIVPGTYAGFEDMCFVAGSAYAGKKIWDLTYNYRYPLVTSNTYGAGSTIAYRRTFVSKILNDISSTTSEAVFSSSAKYTGTTQQRLNKIYLYDKREGFSHLVRQINFLYSDDNWQDHITFGTPLDGSQTNGTSRVFLSSVQVVAGCSEADYVFGYNNNPALPSYDSPNKDQWGLYKTSSYSYQETSAAGTLCTIVQPLGGFTTFFYQPHDFVDASGKVVGGGIRVRKIITYDGVSSNNDLTQQFYYTQADGVTSSGRLQHRSALSFSVAEQGQFGAYLYGMRYRDLAGDPAVNAKFTLTGNQDMSVPVTLNGSLVAYQRVTMKISGQGQTVYEYDLPASADDVTASNPDDATHAVEWSASTVLIARPNTSPCLETTPNITPGPYRYPFPRNSNYEFARGQLRKITNYNEANVKVRDVVNTYKRIYAVGNSDITKIYGLSLEELPTYSYNGAYTEGKMFLYSRYAIFTNVRTELSTSTETVYNSSDLSQYSSTMTSYYYDSPNHRELTKVEMQNSDGSMVRNKFVYNKDFVITTASGAAATALVSLRSAKRTTLVESLSSKIIGGTENYVSASLSLFQTISGVVYPDKQYSFVSAGGSTTFTPASISGGTTFQFDQNNYVLDKSFLSFDSYGNATSVVGRSRQASSASYGYMGTLPVIQVSGAAIGEVGYSDFETAAPVNFTTSGFTPTYSSGRTGTTSKALNLPAGSATTSMLVLPLLTYNKSPNYTLSAWINSGTAGTLSVKVFNIASNTTTTYTCSYPALPASTPLQYYTFTIPVGNAIGTNNSQFYMFVWSSTAIQIDDIAFYPSQADIVTSTYMIPNGKISDTDSRGASSFYDNDSWGRPLVVYDRDRNVIKKYSY